MRTLLTVFSTPKPFTDPHIAMIQTNAIKSWLRLGSEVEVLMIGDEDGVAEAAKKEGVRLIRDVARNLNGTPLVSSIFQKARENSDSSLLAYVNADILLTPGFYSVGKLLQPQAQKFLAVGRRWDLEVKQLLDFSPGWVERLEKRVKDGACLHPAGGSDFFIFPRDCFMYIPALAIGRAGWDNWMIYEARRKGWPVVETSPTYKVIHQQHDYSHLPGGKPHYRHPESDENVRLAGGRHAIYTLLDANYLVKNGRLVKTPLTWKKIWREVEIFPITVLKCPPLARLNHVLFHPVKSYWRFRVWLSHVLRGRRQ